MTTGPPLRIHERWAQLRFSIVGPLLASPPEKGELRAALEELAAKQWRHPISGKPVRFGFSTIERWYHQARRAKNPVGSLRRKVRADAGKQGSVTDPLRQAIGKLRAEHPTWSYQLLYDNLGASPTARPPGPGAPKRASSAARCDRSRPKPCTACGTLTTTTDHARS
jgi:putative transposase